MKNPFLLPVTWLTFLFAFIFSTSAFSQDDLILQDNSVIKAYVSEIGINVITYHRADDPQGPIYEIPKSQVYMFVPGNGSPSVVITPRSGDAPVAESQIQTAPPPMPDYQQPPCPYEGYLWTPGYWAWGIEGYYWVPGVWVRPAYTGYYWTPGYWGYNNGYYGWHEGYWGPHVGYYGGVYYGYGYGGSGYYGGRWEGGAFSYNTAVSNVNVTVVHTTYVDNTVVRNNTVVNRASFNGQGGVVAKPTPIEQSYVSEKHIQPTTEQTTHVATAQSNKSQYFSANQGKPIVTALDKPNGQNFSAHGSAVPATSALRPATQPVKAQPVAGKAPVAEPAKPQPVQPAPSHPVAEPVKPQPVQPAAHPAPAQQPVKTGQPQPYTQPGTKANTAPVRQTRPAPKTTPKPAPKPITKTPPPPVKEEEKH